MLTLLIGVGNPWRGDDAAGLEVARRVRGRAPWLDVRELDGDLSALIELWRGHAGVAVVDASGPSGEAGAVRRFRADRAPLPVPLRSSSHAFGVADAIELARALGRLPRRLDVYAVEGAGFGLGAGLSPAVRDGAASLAETLASAAVRAP